MAARDAGLSQEQAEAAVRQAYRRTPLEAVPRYRSLVEMPERDFRDYASVFSNRVLYPALSALFFRSLGVESLFVVSAVAYIAFGVSLVWLLSYFGRPIFAALLAIAALLLPLSRGLASNDLTDMLAAGFWTVALGAILRLMGKPRLRTVLVFAIACALFALTRPLPYLIVVPAVAASLLSRSWFIAAASFVSPLTYLGAAGFVHGYAIGANESVRTWYLASLLTNARYIVAQAVKTLLPLLSVLFGGYALTKVAVRREVIVLAAAGFASLLSVFFNPAQWDIARVVAFPLVPVFAAIVQAGLAEMFPMGAWVGDGGRRDGVLGLLS